jgi:DNA-binding MarR family transcriptional regulator
MTVKSAPENAGEDALLGDARELARLLGEVVIGLKRTGREAPAELQAAAEGAGLGPRHAAPVFALGYADEESLSVSELSERIGLSLATTSQLVGELSRAGVVERTEDQRDRRRTLVRLPDVYRPYIQAMLDNQIAPMQRALGRLSPQAREHFFEAFRVLREEVCSRAAD